MDSDYNAPIQSDIIAVTTQEQEIFCDSEIGQYVEFLFDNQGTEMILIKTQNCITGCFKTIKLVANASIEFKQLNIKSIKVYTGSGTSNLFYCFQGFLRSLR